MLPSISEVSHDSIFLEIELFVKWANLEDGEFREFFKNKFYLFAKSLGSKLWAVKRI